MKGDENADRLSSSPDSVVAALGFPPHVSKKKAGDGEGSSPTTEKMSATTTVPSSFWPLSCSPSSNDDIWSSILLFLNYDEACRTSRVFLFQGRTRTAAAAAAAGAGAGAGATTNNGTVWREIFLRRGFSPQEAATNNTTAASGDGDHSSHQTQTSTAFDFQGEYARRRRLLEKLGADGPSSCSLALPPRSSACFVPSAAVVLGAGADSAGRHRRHAGGFEFQLASTSVGTDLLVLDRGHRGVATVSRLPTVARAISEAEFMASEPARVWPDLEGDERSNWTRSVLFTSPSSSSRDAVDRARLLPTVYCIEDRTAVFGVALEEEQGITECRFWFQRDGTAPASAGLDVYTCRLPFRAASSHLDFSSRHVFVGASDGKDEGIADSSLRVEAYRMKRQDVNFSRDFDVPSFALDFKDAVLSLKVSPSGDRLVVATACHLFVYDLSRDATPQLVESISFHSAVEKAFEGLRDDSFVKALFGDRTDGSDPLSKVTIHAPRHLPLETAGFVTLQTQSYQTATRTFGNHTLYFWENRHGSWSVYAMVNLPLLLQKTPQIHYDGNRLVAFGQDHIGLIVLVYEVHCTLEAIRSAPSSFANSCCKEASGGVYNFGSARGASCSRVKFANRLRHVGLGGPIEPLQDLQMSCNERFVILRSSGSYPERGSQDDGLLVIDLLDDSLHNY